MKRLVVFGIIFLFLICGVHAYCPTIIPTGMLYCEDFNDQDIDDPPFGNFEIVRATGIPMYYPTNYDFSVLGYDGTGYAFHKSKLIMEKLHI